MASPTPAPLKTSTASAPDAPVVSVLMTVFNRAATLSVAIESVLAQTFDAFELVIVDDGSTDSGAAIAQGYTADPRVRFHRNSENLGDYPNRNRAASLARGRYLKFCDSDDLLYPHCLGACVAAMEAAPQAGLALMHRGRNNWHYPMLLTPEMAFRQHFLGTEQLLQTNSTESCIRASAFLDAGGFLEIRHYGDSDLWFRLAARHPLVLLGPGLVHCRRHGGSETGVRQGKPEVFTGHRDMALAHLAHAECPLRGAERTRAIALFRVAYLRRQWSWWRSGRKPWSFFRRAIAGMQVRPGDLIALRNNWPDPAIPATLDLGASGPPPWNPGARSVERRLPEPPNRHD